MPGRIFYFLSLNFTLKASAVAHATLNDRGMGEEWV